MNLMHAFMQNICNYFTGCVRAINLIKRPDSGAFFRRGRRNIDLFCVVRLFSPWAQVKIDAVLGTKTRKLCYIKYIF